MLLSKVRTTIPSKINLLSIMFLLLLFAASASATPIVQLKLLIITTGSAEQDQGLDLIDDMLDEMGVPYDVLDATQTTLTTDLLVTNSQGNYNGIILTDSSLYNWGSGSVNGSAFTLDEWKILHAYERDYQVRESVLSGYPMSGEYFRVTYDLDYGMDMTSMSAGFSFTGVWQLANNNDIFEYVNKTNNLQITDYTIATHPNFDPDGPVVTPLLTDKTSGKIMISTLVYADGRQVLFSSITNAKYLLYSQVLNYEFLNFATQGVFIGSRYIYLAAHIDDVFIHDELWNPATNTTTGEKRYRNSAHDIDNIVRENSKFMDQYTNLKNFKLDLAFNGVGAAQASPSPVSLISTTALSINSVDQDSNQTGGNKINVGTSSSMREHGLLQFELPDEISNNAAIATLKLTTKKVKGGTEESTGSICLMIETWTNEATWNARNAANAWLSSGGSFDPNYCIVYTVNRNRINLNITSLINHWRTTNLPTFDLLIMADSGTLIKVFTSEEKKESKHPNLKISFAANEPLTDAIVTNRNEFRFLNHTFTHRDMYKSSGATYDIAFQEINDNIEVWQRLGFPEFTTATQTLVTGNNSGLEDSEGSNQASSIFVDYPEGHNPALFDSMMDLGIRYMASDISRPNQDIPSYVPETDILLLPRYPTSLFYNVTTPEELTDEYNYIFYERHIDAGDNPCTISGAICQPRNYSEILAAEAQTTFRHMLTFRPWPHYFHATNLHDYGNGDTLQYDWLYAVTDYFNQLLNLPIINMDYYSIGVMVEEKLAAQKANLRGTWDRNNNTVSLIADDAIKGRITGIAGGDFYGGQHLITTDIDNLGRTFIVDQANE
ncbi:Agd3-related carbohydrate deacetylase [Moritella yayanosii]|uniref:Uncharacterized protein n=1 Tax=Moritella yayanosii TaxID=69539 RepID=A0A330LTD8_9GAMM|nr:DNRLRE domain-containing protein [Moritella yayanosii]SQD79241.1 conserved protein of unknown function [Moritella yayanosii]